MARPRAAPARRRAARRPSTWSPPSRCANASCSGKSRWPRNPIVAVPKLLDLMAIEGAVVTIDAIGCQRDIAQTILDKRADYVLALKGNQGALREDVELFVAEQKSNGFKHAASSRDETVDGDHGRIETRNTTVLHDVSWLRERHDWPGLNGVVIVDSIREIGRTIERETRLFITSLSRQPKAWP